MDEFPSMGTHVYRKEKKGKKTEPQNTPIIKGLEEKESKEFGRNNYLNRKKSKDVYCPISK